jgi:hypothetical protein
VSTFLRKGALFIFACAAIGAGGYLLCLSLVKPSWYSLLRGGAVGAILIALGGYLLWDDFIRPRGRARDRRPNDR